MNNTAHIATEPLVLMPGEVDLVALRRVHAGDVRLELHQSARAGLLAAQDIVRRIVDAGEVVYGINTGFGKLAQTTIPPERLAELQRNLVLSHSAGTGEPLPAGVVRLVLATKAVSRPGTERRLDASRGHLLSALDGSLRRLGVDHIDLYQCHRYDPATPLEETMEALSQVVREGKARYIGFSEWSPQQIEAALAIPGVEKFVSSQPQYSLLWRRPEDQVIPLSAANGIGKKQLNPRPSRGLIESGCDQNSAISPCPTPKKSPSGVSTHGDVAPSQYMRSTDRRR